MSKKLPKVSVVLPTYNRADLVGRAVDSILNQTFENFELIIVDDGSTDNTRVILSSYVKRDSRVKRISVKNGGVTRASNIGVKHARGQYIAWMDDDDLSLPNRLEVQHDFLKNSSGVSACVCFYYRYRQTRNGDILPRRRITKPRTKDSLPGNLKEKFKGIPKIIKVPFVLSPMTMMKKSAFITCGGYRPFFMIVQDLDFTLRFQERYRVAVIPECLYAYTVPDPALTKNLTTKDSILSLKYVLAAYISAWHRRNRGYDPIDEGKALKDVLKMAQEMPPQVRHNLVSDHALNDIYNFAKSTNFSAENLIALLKFLQTIHEKGALNCLSSNKFKLIRNLITRGKIADARKLLVYALSESFRS